MLRAARDRAGLSQSAVAAVTGIRRAYITKLEDSVRCPSRTVAERLAAVLELNGDEQAQLYAAAVTDAGRDHPARSAA